LHTAGLKEKVSDKLSAKNEKEGDIADALSRTTLTKEETEQAEPLRPVEEVLEDSAAGAAGAAEPRRAPAPRRTAKRRRQSLVPTPAEAEVARARLAVVADQILAEALLPRDQVAEWAAGIQHRLGGGPGMGRVERALRPLILAADGPCVVRDEESDEDYRLVPEGGWVAIPQGMAFSVRRAEEVSYYWLPWADFASRGIRMLRPRRVNRGQGGAGI
jgi:hypothetical protein